MNYLTGHARQSIDAVRNALASHGSTAAIGDEAVIDLLTDLRHFCEARRIDFDRANRLAAFHFRSERSLA
jgi:hypothetical protein